MIFSFCLPSQIFILLGPGRPSAGGPRMDRRAVTSAGVVKILRLASRLRRSAQRGPDPTGGGTEVHRLKNVTDRGTE